MKCLVTGAAGFIGSHMVDRLLAGGHYVVGVDNFSTGQSRFLEGALQNKAFQLHELDLIDYPAFNSLLGGCDIVFHFAANADVRFGINHPKKDLEQNTIVTFNILEAMRENEINKIVFSSTGSIYGEPDVIPTPENAPFPIQTSLYGASKLACEGLISGYSEGFGIQSWIFRLVGILGERYTHGHIFDFYQKLKTDPTKLYVLGNGKQRKSYLYVEDCIDAILIALDKASENVNIFNLGLDEYCEVNESIHWITEEEMGLSPKLEYEGSERGWIGDSPYIHLDTKKIQSLGWKPNYSIREGVTKTVKYLDANPWLFD